MIRNNGTTIWKISVTMISFLFCGLAGCANKAQTDNPGYNMAQAIKYEKQGDTHAANASYRETIASYTRAISTEKKPAILVSYLSYRAIAYDKINEKMAAEADYNEALRLCPDWKSEMWVRCNRSRFYIRDERFDAAIDDCNTLIAHEPNNPMWFAMRGFSYAGLGNAKAAMNDVQKVRTLVNDNNSKAYYLVRIALVDLKMNDIEKSMEDLDNAIAIAKNASVKCSALLTKGDVLEMQGQPEAALDVYQQCIRESNRLRVREGAGFSSAFAGGMGGAAGVTQTFGQTALKSSAGALGVGTGALAGILWSMEWPADNSYYREEATRRISRIKSAGENMVIQTDTVEPQH